MAWAREGCFITGLLEKASLMRCEQQEQLSQSKSREEDIFLNKGHTRKSLVTIKEEAAHVRVKCRMAGAEPSDTKEGMRSQRRRVRSERDRQ